MNQDNVEEIIRNLFRCLDKIEDETEVRPGTTTIRGTDGGQIEVEEILLAVNVARSDLRELVVELGVVIR